MEYRKMEADNQRRRRRRSRRGGRERRFHRFPREPQISAVCGKRLPYVVLIVVDEIDPFDGINDEAAAQVDKNFDPVVPLVYYT